MSTQHLHRAKEAKNDEFYTQLSDIENDYSVYNHYDAINIDKTENIPMDYNKEMGVPISFFDKYNPDQFDLVDFVHSPIILDKKLYSRYIIVNKTLPGYKPRNTLTDFIQ